MRPLDGREAKAAVMPRSNEAHGATRKRWSVEVLHGERASGLDLGEPQVSGDKDRSEKIHGHRRAGLLVCAARVSSRDCAWQTLEYFSAAAGVTVSGHDEPNRA